MCSAPIVKQVVSTTARVVSGVATLGATESKNLTGAARIGAGIATLGGSEVLRAANNVPIISKAFNLPGNIVTGGGGTASGGIIPTAAVGLGLVKPDVPKPPPPPSDAAVPGPTDIGGEAPPTPGQPAPGTTTVDSLAAKRRRKLSLLQQGLLSTIATSGSGLSGSANVLSPVAGGTTKSLLGQ